MTWMVVNVERDRRPDERLEGGLVDDLALLDVDRAAHVALEAGVEEAGWVFQRGALGEGELHHLLVRLAGADDAVVRPDRRAHPFPLLDHVGVGFVDQPAHPGEGLSAPIAEFDDPVRDQLRRRLALVCPRLLHGLNLSLDNQLNFKRNCFGVDELSSASTQDFHRPFWLFCRRLTAFWRPRTISLHATNPCVKY